MTVDAISQFMQGAWPAILGILVFIWHLVSNRNARKQGREEANVDWERKSLKQAREVDRAGDIQVEDANEIRDAVRAIADDDRVRDGEGVQLPSHHYRRRPNSDA